MINQELVKFARHNLSRLNGGQEKKAFVPSQDIVAAGGPPPAAPGSPGAPPMDPAMAGGAPPMDPAMAGGMPMDPAMAGGAPLPPPPGAGAGMPPEAGAPPAAGGQQVVMNIDELRQVVMEALQATLAMAPQLMQQAQAMSPAGASPAGAPPAGGEGEGDKPKAKEGEGDAGGTEQRIANVEQQLSQLMMMLTGAPMGMDAMGGGAGAPMPGAAPAGMPPTDPMAAMGGAQPAGGLAQMAAPPAPSPGGVPKMASELAKALSQLRQK